MPRFESEFEQWEYETRVLDSMKNYKWHDRSRLFGVREWTGTEDELIAYLNKRAERNRLLWEGLVFSANRIDQSLGKYHKKHTRLRLPSVLRRRGK